jgi:hypothetical protein
MKNRADIESNEPAVTEVAKADLAPFVEPSIINSRGKLRATLWMWANKYYSTPKPLILEEELPVGEDKMQRKHLYIYFLALVRAGYFTISENGLVTISSKKRSLYHHPRFTPPNKVRDPLTDELILVSPLQRIVRRTESFRVIYELAKKYRCFTTRNKVILDNFEKNGKIQNRAYFALNKMREEGIIDRVKLVGLKGYVYVSNLPEAKEYEDGVCTKRFKEQDQK